MPPKPGTPPNRSADSTVSHGHAAPPPFNHESADLTLRSADGFDFKVHTGILAIASPFFADMFELGGRPDAPKPSDTLGADVPTLQEDAKTLEKLMRLCYPVSDPILETLDEIQPILGAAVKYQLEEAVVTLRKRLVSFIEREPLRIFAIACRYDLEEVARVAAVHALQSLPGPFVDELKYVPSSTYHRLWDLQGRCAGTTSALAANFVSWMSNNPAIDSRWVWFSCTQCAQAPDGIVQVGGQDRRPRTWWREHMRRVEGALRQNPLGKTVRSASVMWPTLSALARVNCTTCVQATVLDDLEAFNMVFAAEVDKVVLEMAESIKFL